MKNNRSKHRIRLPPLVSGQIWGMAELNLQVGLVGKFLVHYKLARPDAVRIKTAISSRSVVEKYLKKNKALLIQG